MVGGSESGMERSSWEEKRRKKEGACVQRVIIKTHLRANIKVYKWIHQNKRRKSHNWIPISGYQTKLPKLRMDYVHLTEVGKSSSEMQSVSKLQVSLHKLMRRPYC